MNRQRILESIFGSSARIKILRVLADSPQPLSGRQIGELAGLTHKGAIQALESIVKVGAVKQRKVGNAYQYSLSRENIIVEKIITPCIKAEAGLSGELKSDIIAHFGNYAVSLVLYGSLARGEEREGSDIDVMAIMRNKRKKSEVEEKTESLVSYYNDRFNRLLSLHCFTVDEVNDKKDMPVIKSAIKEGIVLSGKPISELLK